MPTAEEQVFTKGASLTPTLGAPATVVEQAIELALPTSYRGLVIYSETTPATSGEPSGYPSGWYEWHKRCLWLKPSTGEVFQFNGTTWALAIAKPGANTITGSMIASATIPLSKFLPDAGSSLKVIRVNLGESAFEYIAPADLFAANSIAISKLDGTSAGDYVLTRAAGSKAWTLFDSATIIGLFGANEFPVDYLARGSALQVPMTNAAGTAITWASVLTGIGDYTVPLTKISKTIADAGKWLRIQPDGSVQAETLSTSSSSGTTFASESEVTAGTETSKAISPATVAATKGIAKAFAYIDLDINNGGTDLLQACTLIAGGLKVSSVAYFTSGGSPTDPDYGRVRITLSESLLSAPRSVLLSPGDMRLLVPSGVTALPSTCTLVIERETDTTLVMYCSVLNVSATGNYRVGFFLY